MPIIFNCPFCGRELEAPDAAAGSPGACRFCRATITAPAASGQPAELVSPGTPPPYGGGRSDQPAGYLDFSAIISESWDLLKIHWGSLCAAELISGVAACIMVVALMAPYVVAQLHYLSPKADPVTSLVDGRWFGIALVAVTVLIQPVAAGPLYVAHSIVTRGEADLALVFAPFRRYGALLQFSLVFNLPIVALQLVLLAISFMPDIVVTIFALLANVVTLAINGVQLAALRPGLMEIVDRDVDGFTAAKASWEFTKGHRWMVLGIAIVMSLLASAGVFACGIGVFFTVGFEALGQVLVYRSLRGSGGGSGA